MPDAIKVLVSFRARLILLLTSFLLLMVVVVFVLDKWVQKRANAELQEQNQKVKDAFNTSIGDFAQAINIALQSLSSDDYMYRSLPPGSMPSTVKDIIVAEANGTVKDSTLEEMIGKTIQVPPQPEGVAEGRNIDPIEGEVEIQGGLIKTYNIPTLTLKGLYWFVIVMQQEAIINQIDAAQTRLANKNRELSNYRLVATTGLLFVALAFAVFIGWRFTNPIKELADAAKRVAAGDLDFNVRIKRRDEIGELATTFNEMIAGLKSKLGLEERLSQSERAAAIGRLTQAVAHEIRNPLNVINLSVDQLNIRYAPEDETRREQFTRILSSLKEEIQRLKNMVNDVLNYGRPAHLSTEKIDLRGLVEQTINLIRPQADEQGVRIIVEEDSISASILGDSDRLKSCLSNLAINALQAMPSGGKLTARVHRVDGMIEVSISDTGVGISPESINKVFEPYFSTKKTGFGLGLAVTKKIVEDHRGSVEVTSKVNQGTTFILKLPAANDESGAA